MMQLVIFDMAGTVVDEDNLVYRTLHSSLQQAGFEVPWAEVLIHAAGKEKRDALSFLMSQTLGHAPEASVLDQTFAHFKASLERAYLAFPAKPMVHATELVHALRSHNILVGLNTGYDRPTATRLIEQMGWTEGKEFDLLATADDVVRSRPMPDMILLLMERLGVADSQLVAKVGDTAIDIEEGKAANCGLTVGVTTGAQTRAQLAQAAPDMIIDGLDELTHPLLEKSVS